MASVEAQIRALFDPGSLQNGGGTGEGLDCTDSGNTAKEGQDVLGEDEASQGGGMPPIAGIWLSTGRFDAADLEKWRKGDLEDLAAKMGVDISKAKNNAERAAILAAVEVQAPASGPENGGGAP